MQRIRLGSTLEEPGPPAWLPGSPCKALSRREGGRAIANGASIAIQISLVDWSRGVFASVFSHWLRAEVPAPQMRRAKLPKPKAICSEVTRLEAPTQVSARKVHEVSGLTTDRPGSRTAQRMQRLTDRFAPALP